MKKIFILIVLFITIQKIQSQEVYFNTGKNFTSYSLKVASSNVDNDIERGVGSFYEIGFQKSFRDSIKLNYSIGIALNEFNATGGNTANSYKWNTEYLGLQAALSYNVINFKQFIVNLKGGANVSTIIFGNQEINNSYFNIIKNEEFKGFLFSPSIGLQSKYSLTESGYLSFGYNFVKSYNLSNTSEEKLTFNTNQIQFGIHFLIK